MNRTQHTPGNDRAELVVTITSPVILPAGIVGNILIICVLFRTRARYQSFANYFTALAVTDFLQLFLSLLPRYVEAYVHARFDVDGHLMCRLYSFMYLFLFASSSLLLAAMTAQRAAGVVWPYRAKAACSNVFSYVAICIAYVIAALLAFHVLIVGQIHYTNCYLGSMLFGHHNRSRGGNFMAWIHFFTVFVLPFAAIAVSNYLLISGVNASKRVTRTTVTDVSQSDTASGPRNCCLIRLSRWGQACFIKHMSSVTAILVATSLFFCVCVMPAFLLLALIVGKFIDKQSISPVTRAVLDQLVFLNSSCKFYLYCISGRGFRQELRKICTWLPCGRSAFFHGSQSVSRGHTDEGRHRHISCTSSPRPSPRPTPKTGSTDSHPDSIPTARQRQASPQTVGFEDQRVSPNGQTEPRHHSESGATLPHPRKTSPGPMLSTRSPNTAADTPIQAGETVPSDPHPRKTSSGPMLSTRSPNTAADTPKQAGETVPPEQHLESLPSPGLDMEAEGNVTEPGKIMTLITVLKKNSEDLSDSQDRNRQSTEESSLAASVQEKLHWR